VFPSTIYDVLLLLSCSSDSNCALDFILWDLNAPFRFEALPKFPDLLRSVTYSNYLSPRIEEPQRLVYKRSPELMRT
jgi:hypothetical protein